MSSPILNIDQAEFTRDTKHGDKFASKIAPIATKLGARKLGYNLTVVEPGKRAWPFHNHHANEEMFFVISGSGLLRYGKNEYTVRAGDVVACPPGGPDTAHQFVNTGKTELKFLAISTTIDTDIRQYPDSRKWAATGGMVVGGRPQDATFPGRFVDDGESLDYWHGE